MMSKNMMLRLLLTAAAQRGANGSPAETAGMPCSMSTIEERRHDRLPARGDE